MKTLYSITLICILVLICSACSITRQTTCPTFANKSEKIRKPFLSKKQSSKKKQLSKIADQTKKEKKQRINSASIENIISKIEINDIIASSSNGIALNSTDIPPSFIESKLQKFIYKKIEKKGEKILKNSEKHNQKKGIEEKENCEQVVPKKKRKKKGNSKYDGPTDERETHDLAIVSLLSGILTFITPLFLSIIGGWFLVATILLGIFAIVSGVTSRKFIKKNSSKYKGEEIALIGFILGIIAIGILVLIVSYFFLFFLVIRPS